MAAPNIQQTINESTFSIPVLISFLMHIGIVYFIMLNIDWSSEKDLPPNPIQAFVVQDYKPVEKTVVKQKTPAELEAEAIKVRDAAVEHRRKEQRIAQEQERIRLNKEKQAQAEKERLEKQEQQRLAEERAKAEKLEQARLEKERLEKARLAQLEREKAEEARLLEEALQAEAAELESIRQEELNNELTAEQSRLAQLNAEYKFTIKDKISRNWNKPITTQDNYQCNVLVKQIPGGEIVNIQVQSCTGGVVFKQSVENALRKVKTLPYAGYEEVFSRDIEFTFNPE